LAVVAITISSCTTKEESDSGAVALVERYLLAQKSGDEQTLKAMFPSDAADKWQAIYQETLARRGQLNDYVIESVEPNTVFSGKYFLVTAHVIGATAETTEMITVFYKLADKKTYIVSHKINL
jgi:hypothetical protein